MASASNVWGSLDEADARVEAFSSILGTLEDRLSVAMSPTDSDIPGGGVPSNPEESRSTLVNRVDDITRRIDRQFERGDRLLVGLEV